MNIEGNSTYLLDAPHLLNLEKKRLFARCLSQLRRLSGMRYQLHSILLIQSILHREFHKGMHLSSQSTSEWSRKMFQLSLELDKKEPSEKESVSEIIDDNNSPLKFTRPTLNKARSLLGGNWTSTRRFSVDNNDNDENNNNQSKSGDIPLSVDILPSTRPQLAPTKSFRNDSMISQITIPSGIDSVPPSIPLPPQTTTTTTTTTTPISQLSLPPSSLPILSSSQSQTTNNNYDTNIANNSVDQSSTLQEKKKKGFGKLMTVLKFSKKKSDLTSGNNNSIDIKSQNNDSSNTVQSAVTKETRKMLL